MTIGHAIMEPLLVHGLLPEPDRSHTNALVLEQFVISPSQTSVFQQMLNPDRALSNALEFKQLNLFLLQHLYLSQQLPKPDRALPNALVLEQSVIAPSQTSLSQPMLNPDRALPNALEFKQLDLFFFNTFIYLNNCPNQIEPFQMHWYWNSP